MGAGKTDGHDFDPSSNAIDENASTRAVPNCLLTSYGFMVVQDAAGPVVNTIHRIGGQLVGLAIH
jgi:hypothetical protein